MARGGGRGGGRSSGGGGGRRSGGRSSSGGRGGGGWGSSSSSRSGWGSSSNRSGWRSSSRRRTSRPIIVNTGGYRRRRPYSGFGGNNSGGHHNRSGCSQYLPILIFIGIIIFLIAPNFFGNGSNSSNTSSTSITTSTVAREPLPAGSVNETHYYTDDADWVENRTVMTEGLRYFYQETGVQPHVYITTEIDGNNYASMDEVGEFAEEAYDELFTDEAHLLLVFYEGTPSEYITYYVAGEQAKQVIDNEAADILLDYIDRYYYDMDLNTSEFFSKSFRDAADRIMEVTRSPWPTVFMVFAGVALVALLYFWWKRRKEQEAIEAKRTEEILNTPIDTFGQESEADELAKKYTDENN